MKTLHRLSVETFKFGRKKRQNSQSCSRLNRWRNGATALLLFSTSFLTSVYAADKGFESSVHSKEVSQQASAEGLLLEALSALENYQFDRALVQVSVLAERYPNYALAQLLKADLLAIKGGQQSLLNQQHRLKAVKNLLEEAKVRWQFSQKTLDIQTLLSRYLLKLSAQQEGYFVVVNLPENRLFLFQNQQGQPRLVKDYYVTMGKAGFGKQREGDRRTPIGIYHIQKWIPDSALPDLYGVGALTLDYPNDWDRQQGRTGSGIWLHGTPSQTFVRAPQASRGCVVLNNQAMLSLAQEYRLTKDTPVFLVADRSRESLEATQEERVEVLSELRAWLYRQYGSNVAWQDVTVYRYPNEENLYYVSFPKQGVNSSPQLVTQYWKRGQSGWQLVLQSPKSINQSANLMLASHP
jgi:murein L,D-transpeptidase YafK